MIHSDKELPFNSIQKMLDKELSQIEPPKETILPFTNDTATCMIFAFEMLGADLVISGHGDGTVKLWKLNDGELKLTLNGDESKAVSQLAIAPNKLHLAAASDKSVQIWNIDTKALNHSFKLGGSVTALCFMDDTTLLCGKRDYRSCTLYDMDRNADTIVDFERDSGFVQSIARISFLRYFFIGTSMGHLLFYNIAKSRFEHKLKLAHVQNLHLLEASQVSRHLISSGEDKKIKLWDVDQGRIIHTFEKAHSEPLTSLSTTIDFKFLISAAEDGSLKIWDLQAHQLVHVLDERSETNIEVVTGISPRFGSMVSASLGGTVKRWHSSFDPLVDSFPISECKYVTPIVCTQGTSSMLAVDNNKDLKIWNVHNGQPVDKVEDAFHYELIRVFNITPNAEFIIAAEEDGTDLRVWSYQTKEPIHIFQKAHSKAITVILPLSDSKTIVTGSQDQSIKMWDLHAKLLIAEVKLAHSDDISTLDATKDCRYLASGSEDRSIKVWDLEGMSCLVIIESAHLEAIKSVNITPDSEYVVSSSGDLSIKIWSLKYGELVHAFKDAHKEWIWTLQLSSDARLIVSGSDDKSIKVWDIPSKRLIYTLNNSHDQMTRALTLCDNDTRLLSRTFGGEIKLWRLHMVRSDTLSYYPQLLSYLKTLSLPYSSSSLLNKQNAALSLANTSLFPYQRDLLHYLMISFPHVDESLLEIARKEEVKITLDAYGKSPLDYFLAYSGEIPIQLQRFRTSFFQQLVCFVDYNALNIARVLTDFASLHRQVYCKTDQMCYLHYLKIFTFDAYKHFYNSRQLPIQGCLLQNTENVYIRIGDLNASGISYGGQLDLQSDSKVVLKHTAFALPLRNSSFETLNIVTIVRDNNQVFDIPVVQHLIGYYWNQSKTYLWAALLIYILPLGLLSLYAATYSNEGASLLLIPQMVLLMFYVFNELVEARVDAKDYFSDAWNWIDLLSLAAQIITACCAWIPSSRNTLRLCLSLAIVLAYTKFLVLLRVVDQLRYLIRMLLEILKDSLSFFALTGLYIMAFTLVFHLNKTTALESGDEQSALAQNLLDVYLLLFGDWDMANYSKTAVGFFVLVTLLLTLILLNMIIAIMGDTFDRVQDNLTVFDLKEKLLMIQEVTAVSSSASRLLGCLKRETKENKPTASLPNPFLLVFEPYKEDATVYEGSEWGGRVQELKKDIKQVESSINKKLRSSKMQCISN